MSRALTTAGNIDTSGTGRHQLRPSYKLNILCLVSISIDKLFASLLRAPDPSWTNFEEKKKEDIRLLGCESNVHKHTSTCYKYSKNTEHKICRMRRSHPMINNFNQSIIRVCRCNMDIKFIWSGTDEKALVDYRTDYITKTNLSLHDIFSLVQRAVGPNSNNIVTENSVDKARKLVLRCYNSLASQQELSGVQAVTYLMDYGDQYTSHAFINIFLIAVEHHLQNEEEENASAMKEHFLIEQSTDPQELVLVNLRIDYQYRSPALQSVCLYEFVSLFHRKSFTNKNRNITEHPFLTAKGVPLGPGRPPQERYTFMTEHPQASSHGIIKRLKPVAPVLIGVKTEETQEIYSRAIGTFFIPW